MKDHQEKPDESVEERHEPETPKGDALATALIVLKLLAKIAFKAATLTGKVVLWLLLGSDEEEESPATGSKRDRKQRRQQQKKFFSGRFIRLCAIFGLLVFCLFCGGVLRMLGLIPQSKLPGFTYLNVKKVKQLKDAMSRSGPRIVYCSNVRLTPEQHTAASIAAKALPHWIHKFAVDCSAKLPSGKTVYKRFELDPKTTIMFMQAHGKKAISINEHLIANPQFFHSKVMHDTAYALKHVYDVNSFNAQLPKEERRTLLILTDGRKFNLYNHEHSRSVSRVVDTNRFYNLNTWLVNDGVYEIKFDQEDDAPQSRSFSMYCLVPHKDGHVIGYYGAEPFGKAMETFMRTCSTIAKPNRDFKTLRKLPTLAHRPVQQKKTAPVEHDHDAQDEENAKAHEEVLEL